MINKTRSSRANPHKDRVRGRPNPCQGRRQGSANPRQDRPERQLAREDRLVQPSWLGARCTALVAKRAR